MLFEASQKLVRRAKNSCGGSAAARRAAASTQRDCQVPLPSVTACARSARARVKSRAPPVCLLVSYCR